MTKVDAYTISVPFDSADTLFENRITKLINAKSKLFMKAFNTDKLDFEIKDDTITFKWLSGDATPEMIQASMKFFSLLVKLVKEGNSVKCKEREIHSEKYAMRCFLVRLGFIGDEFKKDRKLLMQNLSGSSAFRLKDGKSND